MHSDFERGEAARSFNLGLKRACARSAAVCGLLVMIGLTLFVLAPVGALAQAANAGEILGAVKDPSGASIPDVAVSLINESSGWRRVTQTNSAGNYYLLDVPSGVYSVLFEKTGFRGFGRTHVALSAGESLTLNASLPLGSVHQSVTVRGGATRVNTATANLGNTVFNTQIENIPLVSRSFTQLVELEPGVASDIAQTPAFGSNTSVPFAASGVGTNSESANNFLVDGGRDIEPYNGNNLNIVSEDAISEISFQSNDYSTQYGRDAGAITNAITKSGTNQVHGSLFEYFQNNAMDSRNFFATSTPEDRYNDFGATVGGPIKKNKAFLFLSYEGRRIILSTGTRTAIVPTMAQINGDFSGLAPITNPVTGAPFPNNQIPASMLNSNSQLILENYYARPTPGFHQGPLNFTASNPDGTTFDEYLGRFDYDFSPKLTFAAHYIYDDTLLTSPFGLFTSNPMPNVDASTEREPIYSLNGSLTWTPSPNFVNVLTTDYFHNSMGISTSPLGSRNRVPALSIPHVYPCNTDDCTLIPTINQSQDYAGIDFLWPENIYSWTYELIDNSTLIKGKHLIKFGGEIDDENKTQDNAGANNNGSFTFTGQYTGNALADMLAGDAFSYSESSTHIKAPLNWMDPSLYVQDQFHASNRLTISPGVRWEYFPPETCSTGDCSIFLPSLWNPAEAATVLASGEIAPGTEHFGNGIAVAGVNDPYGRKGTNSVLDTFEPRFGFAYVLTKDDKTVLRGGYGMFDDRWSQWVLGTYGNYPMDQSASIFNTNVSNPEKGVSEIFPPGVTSEASPWNIPTVQKWSLGLQRQLPKGVLFEADYVGTSGYNLIEDTDINQPHPNLAVAEGLRSDTADVPYLGDANIYTYMTNANSLYNSLQVSVLRQWASGLSFQLSYTYSKSMDDDITPYDSYAPLSAVWGDSTWDRTHILVMNYVYALPFFRNSTGWLGQTLGGWRVSGITTFESGEPQTIFLPEDVAGIGTPGYQLPNLVQPIHRIGTMAEWFNTSAFAVPALGTFGNAGRSLVRGPGENDWDIQVGKRWQFGESRTLEFDGEFFNAFNHTQWSGVDNGVGDPAFGQVTSALNPRIIQLGLHFRF
ncbi:MAG TPA: TonB-dependent receptor [Terriglobia bacterium]|nr:TonB-dependent receptor [Terriglobia bacterium]